MAAGFSGRLFYSKETFQDSIVRVWVEMLTHTLTSTLSFTAPASTAELLPASVAELVEAPEAVEVAEPVEAPEALRPVTSTGSATNFVTDEASWFSKPSNLYGIKYPFSLICLKASSADPSTLNSKT